MSFNASFGQDGLEESNEKISNEDVGINNNNNSEINNDRNNISFEALDNLNANLNNKSNDAVPENNDIFNSIPMEIETEENDRIYYYQNEYLIEKIYYNLNKMIKVINNKFLLKKLFVFLLLKRISDIKHYQIIDAELILFKLTNSLKLLIRIYRRQKRNYLKKYFYKWNNNNILNKQTQEIKQKIEEKIQKENEEKVDNLTKKLNEIEKESKNLNKTYSSLENTNNELKNKIKQFNDKENNLISQLKQLESKNTKFKELISTRSPSISSTSEHKTLESKIKLLENQINHLQDQKKEKENTLQLFISEMEKNLQKYEQYRKNILLFSYLFFFS
jgi:phage shock protein A